MKTNSSEIWMPIPGTNKRYFASNKGRIKGPRKILKNKPNHQGYFAVTIVYIVGHRKTKSMEKRVNRLVASAFFKHYSEDLFVNHMDGNKQNNYLSNLEMVTPLENIRHAIEMGLINNRGENCKTSKLKETDVFAIRLMFTGGHSKAEIARKFDVSHKTIRDIISRKTWSHI